MLQSGYLKLGRFRGVPLRVHWTTPLGALLFGGFEFAPAFWLAFFVLVLVHELGHAALARRAGHRVLAIDITGFGGLCRWAGMPTPWERAVIAWGGVLFQALLLLPAVAVGLFTSLGTTRWGGELLGALTSTNLLLMAINLLPFAPLDGAEAWQLVPLLRARRRGRRVLRTARQDREEQNAALAAFLKQVSDEARKARRDGPN